MKSKLESVFDAQTPQALAKSYDELATSYDDALDTDISPQRAVEALVRHCECGERILDVGCGTGKVGQILREHGYCSLEGLDISSGMLAEAGKKNCYAVLHQQDLGEVLNFDGGTFDAVVSVGVFVRSHAPSSAFDELIRITRPGGFIVFTLRPEFYEASDFKDKLAALTAAGRWGWVETSEPFNAGFKEFPDINLQVWVYQVLPAP